MMDGTWAWIYDEDCNTIHDYDEAGWRPGSINGWHEHFVKVECSNCKELEAQLDIFTEMFRNVERALAKAHTEIFMRDVQ